MKHIFLLFLLGIYLNSQAQITVSPSVNRATSSDADIVAISLTSFNTAIALNINHDWYDGINFSPNSMIAYNNPMNGSYETKLILQLFDNNNNSLQLDREYSDYKFWLIFPAIPRDVTKINLFVKAKGKKDWIWKWYDINVIPRADVDVMRLALTEDDVKNLIGHSKDINAGVYEEFSTTEEQNAGYRLAFVDTEEGTFLVYLGSTQKIGTWEVGEVKAKLRPTVSQSIYKADWFMAYKTISQAVITFEGATMKVLIDNSKSETTYVRMATGNKNDNYNENPNISTEKWTGTGFALKNGFVLTNYHVIEDASSIQIYGVDGDFANGAKATVVGTDKINDLALLKMSDCKYSSSGSIPYGFNAKIADVGENVYVMGYPLTATMGEEVKLTNGIISAKTGFDGDVSQYQVSAPVQPGNSGGPLIDYNGNVIGVVCAKHSGAENVSYAVKASQVRNLIESVSDTSILNTTNVLYGKELKEQVKCVSKYVYIIKCEK